jgi:hypothetical protein
VIELSQRVCRSGVLVLVFAGAAWICVGEFPGRQDGPATSVADLPSVDDPDIKHRAEELERRGQALRRRVRAKAQVVEDVIAGRLTLPEAARQFRVAYGPEPIVYHPAVITAFQKKHPQVANVLEAILCTDVVERANAVLEARALEPGQLAATNRTRERLRKELQSILSPPPPAVPGTWE